MKLPTLIDLAIEQGRRDFHAGRPCNPWVHWNKDQRYFYCQSYEEAANEPIITEEASNMGT